MVWFLHCTASLEFGMLFRRSYFVIVTDNTINKTFNNAFNISFTLN